MRGFLWTAISQIDMIYKRASAGIRAMRRIRPFVASNLLEKVYNLSIYLTMIVGGNSIPFLRLPSSHTHTHTRVQRRRVRTHIQINEP